MVTLLADGKPIGQGRIERTLPNMFSINETLDVGTGKLDQVVLDLD